MITWNRLFFNRPSSYLIEVVSCMYDYVSMILLSILLGVTIIAANTFFRKNFSGNFFENHQLEIVWTISPMFILIFILIPSLKSLYILDTCSFCGFTVRILGHQWYWRYFYKDLKIIFFDSYIIPQDRRSIRLLDVDNRLILPSLIPIRLLVSSSDVIHSWTVPSFGVKIDAVPGRLNQFCLSLKRTGIFFGQCSEICGANHRFIPIVVESIPMPSFSKILWLSSLNKAFNF